MKQPEKDMLWALEGYALQYQIPVATIVEAGACDGSDTLEILKRFSTAHAYAFEPNPDGARICEDRYRGHDRVTFEACAVGDTEGETTFHPVSGHDAERWGSSSVFPLLKPPPDGNPCVQTEIAVPIRRLDAWALAKGVEQIDLLWLDAEGYELNILRGAGELLASIGLIGTEFYITPRLKGQTLFADQWRFLHEKGFVLMYWQLADLSGVGNSIWLNPKRLRA